MSGGHDHDRMLVKRLLRGDDRAFDDFISDFYPRLFRFAVARLGGDRDAAQDVVQETFEQALPRLGSYRGEAALLTWLCGVCRFRIAAHWRSMGRRAPEVALPEDDHELRAVLDGLTTTEPGPFEETRRRELGQLVRVILDHLPVHYGNALEWKYLHEIGVDEIGRRLGVSPKAAESLLTRARRAFREGFASLVQGGI